MKHSAVNSCPEANSCFNSYVDATRIAELLNPYIVGLELPPAIFDQLNTYLDLLLRWNAKTNLTSIRDPEQIVTRHFGESLFAAKVLREYMCVAQVRDRSLGANLGETQLTTKNCSGAPHIPAVGMCGNDEPRPAGHRPAATGHCHLADLGSGAGFPGLPIKLAIPDLRVTLIESQNKKATFLKEVIRALKLDNIEVYNGRAEQWGHAADIVTMRAVEKFEASLSVAKQLLIPGGRLCLLTTAGAAKEMARLDPKDAWVESEVPGAARTVVLVGVGSSQTN